MIESVLNSVEDLRQGKMIIIVDDVDRENEGDVVIAADKVTEAAMTFMAKKASGLVCLSITKDIAERLELTPMCEVNQESMKTAFTVSVDSKRGITTGISASDRVKTILDVVNGSADDIVRPGHMFPVVAKDGGVLERRGHTEASIELVKMAGLSSAAVICEILGDDGKMLRGKDLDNFAKENQLQLVHIEEIIEHLKG
jgi:3,4-dihydroxy 2-butanone 4-phosphate synthase / GTP cyclohydrolase II